MPIWIKICGVTQAGDAKIIAAAGADAIGLNFVPSSKRFVSRKQGLALVSALNDRRPSVIGVFANQNPAEVLSIARELNLDGVQLHGDEPPDELTWFLDQGAAAFKAVRIADHADVARARTYSGHVLLVDAKVGQELGGTGHTFDWSLIRQLNQERKLILAGGLTPRNVESAMVQVAPYGVDTASGVESAPGIKDEHLVREFIRRCRSVESHPLNQS